MDYFHDTWISYLVAIIMHRCWDISLGRCRGCMSKLKSPILHEHLQNSLLEKLRLYYEEIRGDMLPCINALYSTIEKNLPHTDDLKMDREKYCQNAIFFITTSHPDSLYWGRYMTGEIDGFINELITANLTKKSHKLPNLQIKNSI